MIISDTKWASIANVSIKIQYQFIEKTTFAY